jgi:hypothetical protein
MLSRLQICCDTHLLKFQRMQNKVLRTFGKFQSCTSDRELHMALKVPPIYDYVAKLCKQQAEVIHIMITQIFATSQNVKLERENINCSSLAAVKRMTVQVTGEPLYKELHELGHDLLCEA